MAKIPTLTDAPRVSKGGQVDPTLSPGEAGAPFRQVSQIAGQVGNSLLNLRNKQVAEANKVARTKAMISLGKSENDLTNEMKTEYRAKKSNYSGYSDDFMERLTTKRDSILEQVPESVRDSVTLSFDEKFVNMKRRSMSTEGHEQSKHAMFDTKDQIKIVGQDVFQTYDVMGGIDKMNNLRNTVGNSALFDARGKAVLSDQVNNIPVAMLDGVLAREDESDMHQALTDLNDPALQSFFGGIGTKEKRRIMNSLNNKLEYKNNEAKNDIKGKASDLIAGLRGGTISTSNPEHVQTSTNVKNDLLSRLGDEGRPIIDKIEAHETANKLVAEHPFEMHKFDPKAAASEISSDSPDTLKRAGSQAEVQKILNAQKQAMVKEMEEDPATYIAKNDAGVSLSANEMIATKSPQAYNIMINATKSRYEQMNTPTHQRTYMNKKLRDHYGEPFKTLIDAGDYKSAEALMTDFDTATNGNGYKHFDELGVPKEYSIVSEMPDKQDRLNALRNLQDKELNPLYEERRLGSHIKEKDVDFDLHANPLLEAMKAQDGGSIEGAAHSGAMYNAVKNEYKRILVSNPNIDHKSAVKEAWKPFEKRYDVIRAGGSYIPLPKSKNGNSSNFINSQNFVRKYTGRADYVKDFNIRLPKKKNSNVNTTAEEMNDSLMRNSKWVYDRRSEGLALMTKNEMGKWQPSFDNDGDAVVRTFEQVNADIHTENAESDRERNLSNIIKRSQSRGRDL